MKSGKWSFFCGSLAAAVTFSLAPTSEAAVFFWDNGAADSNYTSGNNWNANAPAGGPGLGDLAVHNSVLPSIEISTAVTVDSLRLSDGGSVNHTNGQVVISGSTHDGLWIGEFGLGTYNLSGGLVLIQDGFRGFQMGRNAAATGVLNMLGGTITNTVGPTNIGLNGSAEWNQSAGNLDADQVFIGRNASSSAQVNLGGTSTWNTGVVLLADGHTPTDNGPAELNLFGSNISLTADGLIAKGNGGEIGFTADASGISTIVLDDASAAYSLDNAALSIDLSAFAGDLGFTDITLIDGLASSTGTGFQGLAEGDLVSGANGRTITYVGGADGFDVVLLAVPEPSSLVLASLGFAMTCRRRRNEA